MQLQYYKQYTGDYNPKSYFYIYVYGYILVLYVTFGEVFHCKCKETISQRQKTRCNTSLFKSRARELENVDIFLVKVKIKKKGKISLS
jgi:hypothetical protein